MADPDNELIELVGIRGRQLPMLNNEAWRCGACGSLIYNVDAQGYPAPGAPMPHYWNVSKPAVCAVCYALGNNLATNEYWVALHREWRQEEANAKQNKDKLTGKRDYFTGM